MGLSSRGTNLIRICPGGPGATSSDLGRHHGGPVARTTLWLRWIGAALVREWLPLLFRGVGGATELVTTTLIAVGSAGRVAGLALAVVMVDAAAFGDPNAANLSALSAALDIAALDTGKFSLGPSTRDLIRQLRE